MDSQRSLRVLLLRLAVMASAAAMLYFCIGALHAAPMPQMPAANAAGDYRLGPGDKVRVIVFGEDDLGGEYEVDGSGFVRLPLIGQVKASGDSAHVLEASIAAALKNGYLNDPHVSVEVTTYRPFYIIGAVAKPGEYPYVNHMNALNAVAVAGGFTTEAKDSVVYVRHEGSTQEQRLAADQSTLIRPGDVVRVDTTIFWDAIQMISPLTGFAAIAGTRY